MEKRILQVILVLIGLVPLVTGIWGMIVGIPDNSYNIQVNIHNSGNVMFDSNYRYYSGIWLGLGLLLLWIVPSIEKHTILFRWISCMIFIGGIGRVLSMILFAVPSLLFVFFTIIELLFPLLVLLQNKVAKSCSASNHSL